MINGFKKLVASGFETFGYEIRRIPQTSAAINSDFIDTVISDSFLAQQSLLTGKPVQTIFDVGAYIGDITAKYAALFPLAKIYSFEPTPQTFEQMLKRFESLSLVKPINSAVSNKIGESLFYLNKANPTNSLLPPNEAAAWVDSPDDISNVSMIKVSLTTIDDFCKQQNIKDIQILKMDVQGEELRVLQGGIEKLKKHAIGLIYTEVLFVPVYKGQAMFHEICSFLSDYGYTLFGLYNCAYAKNGQVKWADALFTCYDNADIL